MRHNIENSSIFCLSSFFTFVHTFLTGKISLCAFIFLIRFLTSALISFKPILVRYLVKVLKCLCVFYIQNFWKKFLKIFEKISANYVLTWSCLCSFLRRLSSIEIMPNRSNTEVIKTFANLILII